MSDLQTDGQRLLDELSALSVRGLAAMADRHTGLFPHKVVIAEGIEPRGENALYSAISLIGLLRSERDGEWTAPQPYATAPRASPPPACACCSIAGPPLLRCSPDPERYAREHSSPGT